MQYARRLLNRPEAPTDPTLSCGVDLIIVYHITPQSKGETREHPL